ELTIKGPIRMDDICTHQNLHTLRITFYGRSKPHIEKRAVDWDLSEKSPILCDLSLRYLIVDSPLCQRLLEHPHLKKLELAEADIKGNALRGFWEACRRLESLRLRRVKFNGLPMSIHQGAVLERIRNLVLEQWKTEWNSMFIAFHCPMLETLELNTLYFRVRISIHQPIQKDRWDVIRGLGYTFHLEPDSDDWDSKWATLIDAIGHCFGSITHFMHDKGKFGPRSTKALSFHFNTLVSLDTLGSNPDISSMIRAVLCSCPKLEYLQSGNIFARDIVQDEPWVCQSLQELAVSLRVGEMEQDLQPLIFERLSSLVRLKILSMYKPWDDNCDEGVLNFRLDCGLGQLVTLKELAFVAFPYSKPGTMVQRLEMEDVEWMMNNWKNLKGVDGVLNCMDSELDQDLYKMFRSHDICMHRNLKQVQDLVPYF
ncbi:hypothetical protein BGX34_007050, partial [Mortierella sp. NVP85]